MANEVHVPALVGSAYAGPMFIKAKNIINQPSEQQVRGYATLSRITHRFNSVRCKRIKAVNLDRY